MKKVMAILMMAMMAMMTMMSNTIAEEAVEKTIAEENTISYAYSYKDYVWFDSIIKEFDKAVQYGEEIDYEMYLYDGYIYDPGSGINVSQLGYEGNKNDIRKIEDFLTGILENEGAKFPQVKISFAGENYSGENVYLIKILMMQNINEYEGGELSGSGFIRDGLFYNGIISIGAIY